MARRSRNTQRDFVLIKLSVTIGFALRVLAVSAQCGQGVRLPASKDSKPSTEDIRFEVVSIHPLKELTRVLRLGPTPNGFDSQMTTSMLVKIAYAPESPMIALVGPGGVSKVLNLPNWANDLYEIKARVAEEDLTAWQSQGSECKLLKSALRILLKERFQLVIHEEKIEIPVYDLVIAKNGPKLKLSVLTSEPAHDPAKGIRLASGGVMAGDPRDDGRTELHFNYATMDDLAEFLGRLDLPVQNRTNLTGRYDFVLLGPDGGAWDRDSPMNGWPIDQLGLEVKGGKAEGIDIVVDHVEKPSEN
jgi:uncharacterized protein (TIGR03435 family)